MFNPILFAVAGKLTSVWMLSPDKAFCSKIVTSKRVCVCVMIYLIYGYFLLLTILINRMDSLFVACAILIQTFRKCHVFPNVILLFRDKCTWFGDSFKPWDKEIQWPNCSNYNDKKYVLFLFFFLGHYFAGLPYGNRMY